MKKLFTLVALLALTTAGASYAAGTYTESVVNKYTSGIAQKEQQMRNESEARQQAREAQKAEFQKKVEADKAAREAKQAEADKKIQQKKDALNTLLGK